ncbi:MAG: competence/damage-inducible protein A [Elusimicrobiota bacterium]
MSKKRVHIICVGTELLLGKVNTHVSYMGPELLSLGYTIDLEQTVSDEPKLMEQAFRYSFAQADVILCAGGLGPTFDDITRDVWSKILKRPLLLNPSLVEDIEKKFSKRGIPMPPQNKRQAYVLKTGKVLPNSFGTAPGQLIQIKNKTVILLPGPTRELVPIFKHFVLPVLKKLNPHKVIKQQVFQVMGVPESKIDQLVRPVVDQYLTLNGCVITHGILASQGIVSVKFLVEGSSSSQVNQVIKVVSHEIKKRIGSFIFTNETEPLEKIIFNKLLKARKTLAVAESCTGGLLSKLLTDIPGSSKIFLEGLVTYQNASKVRHLGVNPSTLKKFGAVSDECAREMVLGVKNKSKATHALSITGIAGPQGGTKEKPVGLIYVGYAGPKNVEVKQFQLTGDRFQIRQKSCYQALLLLLQQLEA